MEEFSAIPATVLNVMLHIDILIGNWIPNTEIGWFFA